MVLLAHPQTFILEVNYHFVEKAGDAVAHRLAGGTQTVVEVLRHQYVESVAYRA